MSTQDFTDYLNRYGLVELLGNDNPFLKNVEGKELPFLFAFKPDSYRPETGKDYYGRVQYSRNPDPFLVQKERAALEVKFNAVLANHAKSYIKRWEDNSKKDDFYRQTDLFKTLFTKIKKQFDEDKIFCIMNLSHDRYDNQKVEDFIRSCDWGIPYSERN